MHHPATAAQTGVINRCVPRTLQKLGLARKTLPNLAQPDEAATTMKSIVALWIEESNESLLPWLIVHFEWGHPTPTHESTELSKNDIFACPGERGSCRIASCPGERGSCRVASWLPQPAPTLPRLINKCNSDRASSPEGS